MRAAAQAGAGKFELIRQSAGRSADVTQSAPRRLN